MVAPVLAIAGVYASRLVEVAQAIGARSKYSKTHVCSINCYEHRLSAPSSHGVVVHSTTHIGFLAFDPGHMVLRGKAAGDLHRMALLQVRVVVRGATVATYFAATLRVLVAAALVAWRVRVTTTMHSMYHFVHN